MIAAKRNIETQPPVLLFGLTGGIASGKSFVASLLVKNQIPVVDADLVAREVVQPGSMGLEQLVQTFGEDILQDDILDRSKLGQMVFGKPDELKKLNTIMQPLIAEHSRYLIQLHLNAGCSIVCYDATLIVELGLQDQFRPLVVVSCSPEIQLERLMKRGLSKEDAEARIASQLPTETKIAVSNVVIDTNGSKEQTQEQVMSLIVSLTS